MDLNLLVVLDALLEEGSVTGAADRLHLSPPAVSRALGRIRRTTQDQVLVRTGRTMTPTPYALRVRAPVHALVAQAGDLLAPDRELSLAGLRRTFSLQCHDAISTAIGPRLVEAVRRQAPGVALRILAEGTADTPDLRRGQIDLEIGSEVDEVSDVRFLQIVDDRLVVAMRRDHPCAGRELTLEAWTATDQVTVSRRGRLRDRVDELLARRGMGRRVVAAAPTTAAALAMVAAGDVVALVPHHTTRTMLDAFGLLAAPVPLPLPASPILLAWHRRYDDDRAHAWLRELVGDTLREVVEPRQDGEDGALAIR